MFASLFLIAFLFMQAVLQLSPETVVSYIIGALVTVGATAAVKNMSKTKGLLATALTFVIAFVVAVVGFMASTYLSGGELSVESVFKASSQIFTLAQFAYRGIAALTTDNSSGDSGDTPSDGNATAAAF